MYAYVGIIYGYDMYIYAHMNTHIYSDTIVKYFQPFLLKK
jgi:hypothetical protein